MFGFSNRAQQVAPPPPAPWDGPPLRPDLKHVYFDDLDKLNAYCSIFSDVAPGQTFTSCYAVGPNTIALPTTKAWPSQAEIDAMDTHERGHAAGAVHNADGTGWIPRQGVVVVDGTPMFANDPRAQQGQTMTGNAAPAVPQSTPPIPRQGQ